MQLRIRQTLTLVGLTHSYIKFVTMVHQRLVIKRQLQLQSTLSMMRPHLLQVRIKQFVKMQEHKRYQIGQRQFPAARRTNLLKQRVLQSQTITIRFSVFSLQLHRMER